MKLFSIVVLGLLVLASQVYGVDEALKVDKDKLSYTFGANFGKSLKQQEIEINTDMFIKGIKDGLTGDKMLLTDQEMKDTMMAFQKEMAAITSKADAAKADGSLPEPCRWNLA